MRTRDKFTFGTSSSWRWILTLGNGRWCTRFWRPFPCKWYLLRILWMAVQEDSFLSDIHKDSSGSLSHEVTLWLWIQCLPDFNRLMWLVNCIIITGDTYNAICFQYPRPKGMFCNSRWFWKDSSVWRRWRFSVAEITGASPLWSWI